MMHHPIQFKELGLYFPHKTCFQSFTTTLHYGQRIALIGRNGSGKSSLLKMLAGKLKPAEGEIRLQDTVKIAYVEQVITGVSSELSGGQRFNKALTTALAAQPNVLLLDEPTNHLDQSNRAALLRMLSYYRGTLVIASHDVEVLRTCVDTFWHFHEGSIQIFSGAYDDYLQALQQNRQVIEKQLVSLKRQKKELHQALMKEQVRAKTSRIQGEKHVHQRKWPTVVSLTKAQRAQETAHQKKKQLQERKEILVDALSEHALPERIQPSFSLTAAEISDQVLVSISAGSIGYDQVLVKEIYCAIRGRTRIAINGANGSGKSTLLKAILNDPSVKKTGEWILPRSEDLGYLDQHYTQLEACKTVLEIIQAQVNWTHGEIRCHLNTFLFRKNAEINTRVADLSGGEKARLMLALIAAKTPKLLILDEITNNVDLETRNHILSVLQAYPGALIVVSHDSDFLAQLNLTETYRL